VYGDYGVTLRIITLPKLNLLTFSREGKEISTLLGPLEKANLQLLWLALSNGPNRVDVSLPSPEKEACPVSGTFCSLVIYEFRTMDNVQKPSDSDL
jgi:hypothetical protein